MRGTALSAQVSYDAAVYRATLGMAAVLLCPALQAYSVLTHEAIIDTAWNQNIQPLLLKRFPTATPDDLLQAHANAYGGCIIQDMGYYPFGSRFFSDLVHYVRTGDFIVNLLQESQTLDEYAFALGALAHFAADTQGHSIAVNRSVPLVYPKLEKKFGHVITYADDIVSHLRVEFSFDVLQVARGNYAPKAYHDFIGFQVSKELLERAFHDTYSLELKDVFGSLDLALGTYRHMVSGLMPEMTSVAWNLKKQELRKSHAKVDRRAFVYNLSKSSYKKEWGGKYEQPGVWARFLSWLIRILPKIGPLRALSYSPPTPQTAKMFEDSFDQTLTEYRRLLADQGAGSLQLENRDFDTGKLTAPAEYSLADNTYAKLLRTVEEKHADAVDPKLREDLLGFYRNTDLPFATKKDPKAWQSTLDALAKLKQ
jgi:hypothetical protein